MNDDIENQSPETEESFAELFESYSAGMNDNIRVGDRIRGRIISIGTNDVFVDTGTKADGVVEKSELLDEDGQLPLAEGDELDLYVVTADESEIRLSKAISGIGGVNMLMDAWEQRIPVEGKVVAAICHAPWILVSADVVRGRKIACPSDMAADVTNAGGICVKQRAVRDGNLITAVYFGNLPEHFRLVIPALMERRR